MLVLRRKKKWRKEVQHCNPQGGEHSTRPVLTSFFFKGNCGETLERQDRGYMGISACNNALLRWIETVLAYKLGSFFPLPFPFIAGLGSTWRPRQLEPEVVHPHRGECELHQQHCKKLPCPTVGVYHQPHTFFRCLQVRGQSLYSLTHIHPDTHTWVMPVETRIRVHE